MGLPIANVLAEALANGFGLGFGSLGFVGAVQFFEDDGVSIQ